MATLTEEERQAFLAEVRVGVIALEWGDRAPLGLPVWYDYEIGGQVRIYTFAGSLKDKLLRRAGRFSLTVQEEELPYRYVMASGPVTAIEPSTREWVGTLATRYLGEERGARYAEHDYEPRSVVVTMRPEKWFSGRFLYQAEYSGPRR